jgi:hypothetical protein
MRMTNVSCGSQYRQSHGRHDDSDTPVRLRPNYDCSLCVSASLLDQRTFTIQKTFARKLYAATPRPMSYLVQPLSSIDALHIPSTRAYPKW